VREEERGLGAQRKPTTRLVAVVVVAGSSDGSGCLRDRDIGAGKSGSCLAREDIGRLREHSQKKILRGRCARRAPAAPSTVATIVSGVYGGICAWPRAGGCAVWKMMVGRRKRRGGDLGFRRWVRHFCSAHPHFQSLHPLFSCVVFFSLRTPVIC